MSMHVRALELMLADGSITRCSRSEDPDLFMASLCGLGATGLILSVTLDVEPAFNLKDHQYSVPFDEAVTRLPEIVPSAEHFRAWWFPQADSVRLSMCNRTEDVSCLSLNLNCHEADCFPRCSRSNLREAGFGTAYVAIISSSYCYSSVDSFPLSMHGRLALQLGWSAHHLSALTNR